ncbi:hypothetical protein KAFR_0C00870 [Kazachstania africana CBS 2517]|uniref:Alpha-1,2-mannosyltransferase MNN2 n=1 Tax=Kazachstania africana (strain ATCC 22294 / BCRC 22015 / CBS 2517 / CECT 1963 / NBRC 1671 / NRRL Y-8276) TaxID=1071382 RepID=H2ART2_KAZAF|nr:hypothetical protein KAFR_0C00870 [Kazachstania africana CBS 2517]CCF57082.1 hypothetical protein KAFR_0C00870 [Kazachstania africana CBS 2517]
MAVVNKRFSKLFILLVSIGFFFLLTNRLYINNDSVSVKDYKEYLQSYINNNAGDSTDAQGTKGGDESVPAASKGKNPVLMSTVESNTKNRLREFYNEVFQYFINYSPSGKSARHYQDACQLSEKMGNRPHEYASWYKLSYTELNKCLSISKSDVLNLKTSHKEFVENLGKLVLPKNSYKGNGIVTVGGGKFSLMSLLVIRTLRNLGTTLPVEVFIPPQEEKGEMEFCNKILPQYHAKCIYISDILPQQMIDNFEFAGYQFKSLAIIASSFENLLLLDADNFPIKPLDHIFEEEPYVSTGLVLWPDFWRRTTQPLYYEIADVSVDFKTRVRNSIDDITPPPVYTKDMNDLSNIPLHDLKGTIPDVSTESGQLMISKSKHLPTVLLALYYNVNGPSWYYPIFSQKASGEGDKETFLAAANFYDLPYYQIRTEVGVDGYHQPENKGFRGVAMLQHDFAQDYKRYVKAKEEVRLKYGKDRYSSKIKYDPNYDVDSFYRTYFDSGSEPGQGGAQEVDVMFIHSNLPKFEPLTSWKTSDLIIDGKHIRSFTNLKRLKNYDIELENFKIYHEVLCEQGLHFKYLDDALGNNKNDKSSMCKYISDRLDFLQSTHEAAISN